MVEFNLIGFIIVSVLYFPYIIYLFFPPKNRIVKPLSHKQLKYLSFIGKTGITFFSILTIGYGYQIINNVVGIIYLSLASIIMLFNYSCYIRYMIKGRQKEDMFSKFLIPYPIQISEYIFIMLSGILLINPYIIFFGIWYIVSNFILTIKLKREI